MYLAMNRFKIHLGKESLFEEVWRSRDSRLKDIPGFREFHLLKGPATEDHCLYSSHTVWESEADFRAWTESEAFKQAHSGAGQHKGLYMGHPEFEGFESVLALQ